MTEEITKKKSNMMDQIDYKNLGFLKKFLSESGKISPRRVAGTSAKEQRKVNKAIKIARHLALLPFCDNHKQ
tara:strand:+ start:196 stop:411 length:216 start_codon:yes stop_codon:yes gene_type:complete